ncbi:D-amino-acid transaminase [Neobacillus notoginsengisoli]|uniref:D-alanine aminotransferase n=1 Tax=Neobacillus notoginsengisoli TaxID=1578198 RepID=A0A417YUK0_9BACI|nr:D-amino-acid transaminase [Neobacillus notoginsengisoli]RHW40795.1 D-amino-acid transaminase [Neobacillus notoginsengisoli]
MEYVILNGEILPRQDARIDVEDRGYQFGDGVYEVIRIYNGKMFTVTEHLERLEASAEKIGMKLAWTITELEVLFARLIEINSLETGIVYMQVTRGISPRSHAYPPAGTAQTLVAYTRNMPRPELNFSDGVKTILTEDIRWLRCDIKSLNLLGNIMAKQKAAEAGCYEAILHRGEKVTEGSSSNIFIIKDGSMYTHPANNFILNGITRQTIEKLCAAHGIPFIEKEFSVAELEDADEVIVGSTTSEVTPVVEIEGKPVGDGKPGHVTRQLQKLFDGEIERQCGKLVKV